MHHDGYGCWFFILSFTIHVTAHHLLRLSTNHLFCREADTRATYCVIAVASLVSIHSIITRALYIRDHLNAMWGQ